MDVNQMCCDLQPFLRAINLIITILKWSVPLLLILLGTIDMVKAAATADEKVIKEVQSTFMKRLLYGVIIFLVPFLVNLVLSILENYIIQDNMDLVESTSWISCWNNIVSGNDLSCSDDIYNN